MAELEYLKSRLNCITQTTNI